MSEASPLDQKRFQHDMEMYKLALNAQMHFNELLIRSRTTVVSVAMAVLGGTVIALRQLSLYFEICKRHVHISVAIPVLGVVFLFGQFLIDFFYYLPLLLGL